MRAARKVNVSHGKAFEKKVHEAMTPLQKDYPILWERVIDSHDAGNLIRQADCDFKLIGRRHDTGEAHIVHIECKASVRYASLRDGGALRQMIKAGQVAKLRLAQRAGVNTMILFHSVKDRMIECWDGVPVCEAWARKRTKFTDEPFARFPVVELKDFLLQLVHRLTRGP